MRISRALVSLLACAAVLPGTALAQQQVAPPGNSGVDEYLETIPDAHGNKPVRPGGSHGGTLDPGAASALKTQGKDGAAAAALAENTAPDTGGSKGASRPASKDYLGRRGGSGGIAPALIHAVDGSDSGMGPLLPILLAGSVLAALGFVLLRRRRA